MTHALPPHRPAVVRRAPPAVSRVTVIVAGKTVGSDGVTYLYAGTLTFTPQGVTPPVPVPPPVPPPVPVPMPTPLPLVPVVVNGYRDGNRNWANLFSPGQTIFIEGQGFGAVAGTVSVNHAAVVPVMWSDTEIQLVCPAAPLKAVAGPVPLDIMRADRRGWSSTLGFTLVPPPGARVRVPF